MQIALLRSLPLFAELPAPPLEGMARALTPVTVPAGTELIRQGDPGDAYYAIAAGELDATQDRHFLRRCGRGEGVGEIALLRDIPRTATMVAHTAATVYKLDREPFLTAVLGHAPTQRQADRIAGTRLATSAAPSDSMVLRIPRSGEPATNFSAKATSSRQACQASSTTAGSAAAPAQSASARSSDQYSGGASACAITRRNQVRSTSAMWRMRPSRDMAEGGTDRRASWAGSRPAHFISIVSR